MTTSRNTRASAPGPAQVWANVPAQTLTVTVDPSCTYAELTISTADDSGPSADAVRDATLGEDGAAVGVRLDANAGDVTVVNGGVFIGSGGVQVNSFGGVTIGGNNYGTISTGRGVTINGRHIPGSSPIIIAARVPAGSTVRFTSQSGDLTTHGPLRTVEADTKSGDVDIDTAAQVTAKTMSGDIRIGELVGSADLNSMSGDISVTGGPGATVQARTMSGDVCGSGGLQLAGSSMSGRVRNR